jgi:uncharacterized membrane protein
MSTEKKETHTERVIWHMEAFIRWLDQLIYNMLFVNDAVLTIKSKDREVLKITDQALIRSIIKYTNYKMNKRMKELKEETKKP